MGLQRVLKKYCNRVIGWIVRPNYEIKYLLYPAGYYEETGIFEDDWDKLTDAQKEKVWFGLEENNLL